MRLRLCTVVVPKLAELALAFLLGMKYTLGLLDARHSGNVRRDRPLSVSVWPVCIRVYVMVCEGFFLIADVFTSQ